jgi:hypothetical protein
MVRLDENETDDPRAWALDPGLARALRSTARAWLPTQRAQIRISIQRSSSGWPRPSACTWNAPASARSAPSRSSFVTTAARQQISVHHLRGTFVTLALANGRPESWVMARTGHRSSQMVNRYRRIATSFAELNLGELAPLDQAIPALMQRRLLDRVGHQPGQPNLHRRSCHVAFSRQKIATPTGLEPVLPA